MSTTAAAALRRYANNADDEKPLRQRQAELVEEHGALVRKVARRIFRRLPAHIRGFDEEDLVSVGILGLLEAHDRWDPEHGTTFESFAEFRIKGAILDEIRRNDLFPRRLRATANRLKKAEAELEVQLGRPATDDEVARAMEMDLSELYDLRRQVAPYVMVPDHECVSLRSPFPEADRLLAAKELRTHLLVALEELGERHKLVLDLYFNHELRLKEIGELLDVTEGRVCQIKAEALETLKKKLKSKGAV